jgi:hypothetical protein
MTLSLQLSYTRIRMYKYIDALQQAHDDGTPIHCVYSLLIAGDTLAGQGAGHPKMTTLKSSTTAGTLPGTPHLLGRKV